MADAPGEVCKDCASASICQYKESKPVACTLKNKLGSSLGRNNVKKETK